MMLTGILIAGIAVLLGNSHAARAARAAAAHSDDGDAVAELGAARGPLIVGGLTVTTLILLAWPQPSARVYGAACLLFVLYAGTVVTLSSTTGWGAPRCGISGLRRRTTPDV